jgi:glutathione S-transferase
MDAHVKIYGIPQSRASRCLWMARELGLSVENVQVHFNATAEAPELLAINPNARIPALDDNGFHLWESMAINIYLAKKYGAGKDFVPASLEEEALTNQWSFWVITEIENSLLVLLMHALGRPPADQATVAHHQQVLARPLKVLDDHLASRRWLLGDRFTVADLNVASVMSWMKLARFDLAPHPRVMAWLAGCLGRREKANPPA